MIENRAAVYEALSKRIRSMPTNEEHVIWNQYEVRLLVVLAALTDAVTAGIISFDRGRWLLDREIEDLQPKEGIVKF